VASVLRSSKALFAEKIVSKLHMDLPDPLPLAGVEIPRATSAQYVSKIEPMLLFQQAERELLDPTDEMLRPSVEAALQKVGSAKHEKRQRSLPEGKRARSWTAGSELREKWIAAGMERERQQRPEMFKAFCLALFAGLRRDAIRSPGSRSISPITRSGSKRTNSRARNPSVAKPQSTSIPHSRSGFASGCRRANRSSSSA
jgi:hypothetical protein